MDFNLNNGYYYYAPYAGAQSLYPYQYLPIGQPPVFVGPQYATGQFAQYYYNPGPQPCCAVPSGPPPQPQPTLYQAVPAGTYFAHNPLPYTGMRNPNPVYLPVAPAPMPPPPPMFTQAQPTLMAQPISLPPGQIGVPQWLSNVTVPAQMLPPPPPPPQSFTESNPFPFGTINVTVPIRPERDDMPPNFATMSVPLADPEIIPRIQEYILSSSSSGSTRFQGHLTPLEQTDNECGGGQAAGEVERSGPGDERNVLEVQAGVPGEQNGEEFVQDGMVEEENDGGQDQTAVANEPISAQDEQNDGEQDETAVVDEPMVAKDEENAGGQRQAAVVGEPIGAEQEQTSREGSQSVATVEQNSQVEKRSEIEEQTGGEVAQPDVTVPQHDQGNGDITAGDAQQQVKKKAKRKKGKKEGKHVSSWVQPLCCNFCKSNGETKAFFEGHNTQDKYGKTICPILRKHICEICGETGDNAHTRRYCPQQQPQQSQNYFGRDRYYDVRSSVGGYAHVKY